MKTHRERRKLAERVERNAAALGYRVENVHVAETGTFYVTLSHELLGADIVVRIADHMVSECYSEPDYSISPAELQLWQVIRNLAELVGRAAPGWVTRTAQAERDRQIRDEAARAVEDARYLAKTAVNEERVRRVYDLLVEHEPQQAWKAQLDQNGRVHVDYYAGRKFWNAVARCEALLDR